MNVLTKIGRRAASLAAVGVVVAATMTALVPSASGAPQYWRINNLMTERCLTADVANNSLAYMAPCSTTNTYQQWTMIADTDSSDQQFKNRATGRCLSTVETTSLNQDVRTSTCSSTAAGQFWGWAWADEVVGSRIVSTYYSFLRTTPANETRVLTFDKAGYDNPVHEDLRAYCYWTRLPA